LKFDLNGHNLLPFLRDKAYTLLTQRDQSVAELRAKLSRALGKQPFAQSLGEEVQTKAIGQTIRELEEQHLLDDKKFSRNWVESRLRFRPRGEPVLRQELRQKGISEEVIKATLSDLLDEESQLAAATKLLKSRQKKTPDQNNRYLASKGFSYSIIHQVVPRNSGKS